MEKLLLFFTFDEEIFFSRKKKKSLSHVVFLLAVRNRYRPKRERKKRSRSPRYQMLRLTLLIDIR